MWNFPIERIETAPNQVSVLKREMLKTEIRKANPFLSYHDHRVEKFLELFQELFKNAISVRKKEIYGNIHIQRY